ncbi:oxygenase MpaB family protein [Catenuloplanes japonicus]|uniref:oxygenase MpaB family protein n=1 Tax=Catenuloplanes japonicus TaxID=33876 RepID=UPI0007C540AA|nr:oxygenase MpaB family protein [Catenuloplanes japonicus]
MPTEVKVPERGSVVWRYFGDSRNMLLGPPLLVLQVAHPVVGAGVLQHSNYRDEPWQRLIRTYLSLSTLIYGGRRGAARESARLRHMHEKIKGVDGQGRRYHALNPEAYLWVHATLVQGGVDSHRIFGRPLTDAQTAEYYAEMRQVGLLLGLREHHLPADWAGFRAYYDDRVLHRLEDNQAVWDVIDSVRRPKKPWRHVPDVVWRPLGAATGRLAFLVLAGALPQVMRDRLGLSWSTDQERRLRRFARLVRILMSLVIPPLRIAGALSAARIQMTLADRRERRAADRTDPSPVDLPVG